MKADIIFGTLILSLIAIAILGFYIGSKILAAVAIFILFVLAAYTYWFVTGD